ncbi:PPE family protein [Mycobacterium sp. M1]|uniref:PPE family protein n=1 Tax=Mycolicibacter acidiphilus TaxID=2835306 RepID=A0ABS5RJG5_9MYCO|nr:PPE family protein [Mycolicibacter acidiphilus]MBS9533723.1 PPE family protein [Mycolicibacter acidiphilus]
MDYGALPPEVNSGRMYAGAGPGPMLAAAAAWNGLAAELHSAAAAYGAVLSDLTAGWHGPSAEAMAAAAMPYVEWMSSTAAQIEQAGAQAAAAAAAYEAAFAGHVPPPVVAANRSLLLTLIATNLLGQNTPAIATTEAHYAEMWAQDAAAMYGYAGSSSSATRLSVFGRPPKTSGLVGSASRAAGSAAETTNASGKVTQALSVVPNMLRNVAGSAKSMLDGVNGGLSDVSGMLGNLGGAYSPFGSIANVGTGWLTAMQILAYAQNVPGVVSMLSGAPPITGALGPLSGGFISYQAPLAAGAASSASTVSAVTGQSSLIGSLSVPSAWSANAPAVKLLSTSLPANAATTTITLESSGGMFNEMALSSLAGRAVGGTTVRTVAGGGGSRVIGRAPDTEQLTTATILVIPVPED